MRKTQAFRHLDLFSGIGGFALAAKWVWGDQHEVVSFCEIEPFCQKVLKKHWPDTEIVKDIRDMKGGDYGTVDLISGGFPCQPYSGLGLKKGFDDNRDMWPEMVRIIDEVKPTWVLGENVDRFLAVGFERSKTDLEKIGYKVGEPFVLPSISKAEHRRNRAWIVAHIDSQPVYEADSTPIAEQAEWDAWLGFTRQIRGIISENDWPQGFPDVCGVDDGISPELDKGRLKALGNAIVPQVAAVILSCIKLIQNQN